MVVDPASGCRNQPDFPWCRGKRSVGGEGISQELHKFKLVKADSETREPNAILVTSVLFQLVAIGKKTLASS